MDPVLLTAAIVVGLWLIAHAFVWAMCLAAGRESPPTPGQPNLVLLKNAARRVDLEM